MNERVKKTRKAKTTPVPRDEKPSSGRTRPKNLDFVTLLKDKYKKYLFHCRAIH